MKKYLSFSELEEKDARDLVKPSAFSGSKWGRYDKYELIKTEDGKAFVLPAPQSRLIGYRPFSEPEILIDFLILGKLYVEAWLDIIGMLQPNATPAQKARQARGITILSDAIAPKIMSYVTKYGLLDIFHYYIIGKYKGKVWTVENRNYLGTLQTRVATKEVDCEEHAKQYFPRGTVRKLGPIGVHAEYGENVLDIGSAAGHMWWRARAWHIFQQSGEDWDSPFGDESDSTWEKKLWDVSVVRNVGIRVKGGDKTEVRYVFKTLLSALEIMFVLSLANAKNTIRICKAEDCNRPFTATNNRNLYCSKSCLSRDKVRCWRARKRMESPGNPPKKL